MFDLRLGRRMLFRCFLSAIIVAAAACDRTTGIDYDEAATCSIAYLKSLCDGQARTLVDGSAVRGTVTGNDRYGEFPGAIVIEDATGGIEIAADYTAADNPYPLGTEVTVYCNGLTLYDYGGKIRLGKLGGDGLRIPHEELAKHLRIGSRKPERIEARPVGIAELNPRHADTYVRIDEVSFTESPAAWCDRDPESGRYTTTERTLTDAAGDTLTVRTAGTALYAGEPLPEGRGSLCGIVDCFNGKYTLRITGFETSFAATPAAPATAYP